MEKFLSVMLTIAIIFFALKLLFKLLMPFIIKRFMNKMAKNMGANAFYYGQTGNDDDDREEGDVSIHSRPAPKKNEMKETMEKGDYVDFEEVQ